MKLLTTFCLLVSVLAGCVSNQNEGTQNYIPGLYVKEIKQEYAIGMDTISINLLDKQASSYRVTRKSSYKQMIDGKMFDPKQEVHNWIAYFDQSKNQLVEPNNERVFTFNPEKNILTMGSMQFRKVNSTVDRIKK